MQGRSSVDGYSGSLQFDFTLPGVDGVPGSPADVTFYYSSASDDMGTYGSRLNAQLRYGDRSIPSSCEMTYPGEELTAVRGGYVGLPNGKVGFGLNAFEAGGGYQSCQDFRMTPATIQNDYGHESYSTFDIASNNRFACLQNLGHDCSKWRTYDMSVPLAMANNQNYGTKPTGGTCPPSRFDVSPGVQRVSAVITAEAVDPFPGTASGYLDFGPCNSNEGMIYVEREANDSIALMGRNWSHSWATHVTAHPEPFPGDGTVVVLHEPSGGYRTFQMPANPSSGQRLYEVPGVSEACSCTSGQLYFTSVRQANGLPFKALELLDRSGNRTVFAAGGHATLPAFQGGAHPNVPFGRLERREEVGGRNPIVVGYDASQRIATLTDAAGFVTTFQYAPILGNVRLLAVTAPGGRTASFLYDALGRLNRYNPPGGGAYAFTYGATGNALYDVATKTSPDGIVSAYDYYTAPGKGGRVWRAKLKDGASDWNVLTYDYSTPYGPELTRWAEIVPDDPTSAPILRYEYHGDGRIKRVTSRCASDCPDVPGVGVVAAMVTDYHYGAHDKLSAIRQFPEGHPELFSVTCFDRAYGEIFRQRGPTCLDENGDELTGWGECDCEVAPDEPGYRPTVAAEVEWVQELTPSTPSALNGGTRVLVKSITTASQVGLSTPMKTRYSYYPDEVGQPVNRIDALRAVCHSTSDVADPTAPGSPCVVYEQEGIVNPLTGQPIVRVTSTRDETGEVWTRAYHGSSDPQRFLLASMQDPEGLTTTVGYLDIVGAFTAFPNELRLPGFTDPIRRTFDKAGRLLTEVRPGGARTVLSYSPEGRLRRVIDATRPFQGTPDATDNVAWWFRYRKQDGLLLKIARGPGHVPVAIEQLPIATAPSSDEAASTTYEERQYDDNERVLVAARGDIGVGLPGTANQVAFDYDGFGMVAKRTVRTDGHPKAECYVNDPRVGSPVRVAYPLDQYDLAAEHDCPSVTSSFPWASESTDYDVAGRVASSRTAWHLSGGSMQTSHVACHARDLFGRLVETRSEVLDPTTEPPSSGNACTGSSARTLRMTFGYDSRDRVSSQMVQVDGATVDAREFAYDAASRLSSILPAVNGPYVSYDYRDNGQLATMTRGTAQFVIGGPPGLTPHRRYVVGYDPHGWPTSLADDYLLAGTGTSYDWTYEYDDLSRLTSARLEDDNGVTPTLFWESYEYLPTDAWNIASVTDEVTQSVGNAFTYDDHDQISTAGFTYALGDLTGMSYGGDVRSYAWTASGRMVHSEVGSSTADYAYDPWNRLVAHRVDGGAWSLHLWEGWSQLGAIDAGSAVRAASIPWGPAGPLGEKRASLPYVATTIDPTRSTKVGIGELPRHDPFGRSLVPDPAPTTLLFHSQEWQPSSSAYYMRHRWYDPATRRFLSRDPRLSHSLASFAFAAGNPVQNWDPFGLAPTGSVGARWEEKRTATGQVFRSDDVYVVLDEGPTSSDYDDYIATYGRSTGNDLVFTTINGPSDPYAGYDLQWIVPPTSAATRAPSKWRARAEKKLTAFGQACPNWQDAPCRMQCSDMVRVVRGNAPGAGMVPKPGVRPWFEAPSGRLPQGAPPPAGNRLGYTAEE